MWSIARTLLWREVETNSSYSRGDKAYRRGFKCLPLDDNVPKRDGFTFEDFVFFHGLERFKVFEENLK